IHPWATKRPAGAGGHVDAKTEAPSFAAGMFEHGHELGGEELDVARLVPARPVDRRDLDTTEADARKLLQLLRQTVSIDSVPRPPPADPWLERVGGQRPRARRLQPGVWSLGF